MIDVDSRGAAGADGFAAPGPDPVRRAYYHDPEAPPATVVVPSVFVAVRDERDRLLLVRRLDSGGWELPGGRVDVGESLVEAAVRETAEEAGVLVRIVGLAGLFTDPAHVVRSTSGEVRQQFVVCVLARPVRGRPRPDMRETVDAGWFGPAAVDALELEPAVRGWIDRIRSGAGETRCRPGPPVTRGG